MRTWFSIGIGIFLLILILVVLQGKQTEGFLTVDESYAQAQRQQLQLEGERRYNDFARLQSNNSSLNADSVASVFQQAIPVPTTQSASFVKMLGAAIGLGAADDGTNKQGTGVEQTGMVQEKINFCESQPVQCSMFADPRFSECGFCHRDGTDSKGNAHRGGMYISSDDQIRANEVATAGGIPAVYQPTIGSCAPQNFTLMSENCQARELQLTCQSAGAATSSNPCAQCFGAAPANATGLLYVGPKPRQYQAILYVSHPGSHSNGGAGLIVTKSDGTGLSLPYSQRPLFDPQQLPLNVTEGDALTITIVGMPPVWCAWLSSPDGNRVVSVDIGAQAIAPENGFMIVGDKRSGPVQSAAQSMDTDIGPAFLNGVPNTVMWYGRRDEVVPAAITNAWYGTTLPNVSNPVGVSVTDLVKAAAGTNADIPINPSTAQTDPSPGNTKHLWIWQDNGSVQTGVDGQTLSADLLYNVMTMNMTVPATLVDPIFTDDKADCPTGPLVFTEIGAGLMGSHSCFTATGAFNATQYCLQELFIAAGGTQKGTAWPNTDAKAQALVVKDATGTPSLDATVAALNNSANIAMYGVDSNGVEADFTTFQNASLQMLGSFPKNPCDGPNAQTGPHTPECLDYLWRTSGNASDDNFTQTDPSTIPYQYCSAAGLSAPLNTDGSTNQTNVTAANGYGAVPNIRTYFQSIFNRANDNSNFDAQATAMQNCFNINIQPPPVDPSSCPPPNPDDWQCFGPEKMQMPEVFYTAPGGNYDTPISQADAVCDTYGARVATLAEVTNAQQQAGADWCATGWVLDSASPYYPITTSIIPGCAGSPGVFSWTPPSNTAGVNCYGIKPPQGTTNVWPFNQSNWNQPQATTASSQVSDTAVPALREVLNKVQCLSRDGSSCATFASSDACQAWVTNPSSDTTLSQVATPNTNVGSFVDSFVRRRV